MPTVNPYTAKDLPSPAVGTPNYSSPVGAAFRQNAGLMNQVAGKQMQLAGQVGQTGDQIANTMLQLSGQNMQGLMNLGNQVVGMIRKHMQNVADQKKLLQQGQLAQQNYAFQESADGDFNSFTQQMQDTPWAAPDAWKDYLHNQKQAILDDPKYAKASPEFKQALDDQLEASIVPRMERMNTWSTHAQSARIHQAVPNTTDSVVSRIANLQGDPVSKVMTATSMLNNASQQFANMRDPLGTLNVQKATEDLYSSGGEALMNNMIRNAPADPVARSGHIEMLRNMITTGKTGSGATYDLPLKPKVKESLLKTLDAFDKKNELDVDHHYQMVDVGLSGQISKQVRMLKDRRWDATAQQDALNWADKQDANLDAEEAQIRNNKIIKRDSVKARALTSVNARRSQLNALRDTAQSNMDRTVSEQVAEQKAAASDVKADQNSELDEIKTQDLLDKQQALATKAAQEKDFKEAKGNTDKELADLQNKLLETSHIDPGANIPQTFQLGVQLAHRADQAFRDGHITRAQYETLRNSAVSIYSSAASMHKGWFGEVNPLEGQQRDQAVAAAKQKIYGAFQALDQSMKQGQADDIAKLSPEAREWRQSQLAAWQKATPQATPQQIEIADRALRNAAIQKFPLKASAPSVVARSIAPADYNGNIDITHRQLVTFPHGLDDTNSTPEARQQFPHEFAPGSHGTEFSIRIDDGDHQVSIPTIFDGKVHSSKQAIDHYKQTGEYLGKWPKGTPAAEMDDYEKRVHERNLYVNHKIYGYREEHAPSVLMARKAADDTRAHSRPKNALIPPPPPTEALVTQQDVKLNRDQWEAIGRANGYLK